MAGFYDGAGHQVRSWRAERPIAWIDRVISAINDGFVMTSAWPNQSTKLKALTIAAAPLWSEYSSRFTELKTS
jgi:hypothetical protein